MRDIESDVKTKMNIKALFVTLCPLRRKRWTIMLPGSMRLLALNSKQLIICSSSEQEFLSYYSLQQYRRRKQGTKQRKSIDSVAYLNKIVEKEGEDFEKLKKELSACQHLLLHTQMENGR